MGPLFSEYLQAVLALMTAMFIALTAHFARAEESKKAVVTQEKSGPLSPAKMKEIDTTIEQHELDPKQVEALVQWLETKEKELPKDDNIKAQLSRTIYFVAQNESDVSKRIKIYQKAIDAANAALKINPENITAHFWIAASIGKQGLDIGITKSLKNAKPMKEHLEKVLAKDAKFENGAAHRALGRLLYKVPGWPVSFRDNEKSKEHLSKAVELAPKHLGNRAFLAETLIRLGNKDEARKHVSFILSTEVDKKHARENAEYVKIAKDLQEDLN